MQRFVRWQFVFVCFFPLTAANADLPESIEQIKPSVVAIGTYKATDSPAFTFRGTGFVFGNGNLIATNAHVLPEASNTPDAPKVVVLVSPNRNDRTIRPAKIRSQDVEHDLAVLHIDGPPLPPVKIGNPATVKEGQAIAFTGFPIGGALGFSPVTHRGIISSITPIALPGAHASQLSDARIRQIRRGTFDIFQLDATAYPGNSGSPVFDATTGQVIGIINMVFVKKSRESALTQPSGISYAIPVNHLQSLNTRD